MPRNPTSWVCYLDGGFKEEYPALYDAASFDATFLVEVGRVRSGLPVDYEDKGSVQFTAVLYDSDRHRFAVDFPAVLGTSVSSTPASPITRGRKRQQEADNPSSSSGGRPDEAAANKGVLCNPTVTALQGGDGLRSKSPRKANSSPSSPRSPRFVPSRGSSPAKHDDPASWAREEGILLPKYVSAPDIYTTDLSIKAQRVTEKILRVQKSCQELSARSRSGSGSEEPAHDLPPSSLARSAPPAASMDAAAEAAVASLEASNAARPGNTVAAAAEMVRSLSVGALGRPSSGASADTPLPGRSSSQPVPRLQSRLGQSVLASSSSVPAPAPSSGLASNASSAPGDHHHQQQQQEGAPEVVGPQQQQQPPLEEQPSQQPPPHQEQQQPPLEEQPPPQQQDAAPPPYDFLSVSMQQLPAKPASPFLHASKAVLPAKVLPVGEHKCPQMLQPGDLAAFYIEYNEGDGKGGYVDVTSYRMWEVVGPVGCGGMCAAYKVKKHGKAATFLSGTNSNRSSASPLDKLEAPHMVMKVALRWDDVAAGEIVKGCTDEGELSQYRGEWDGECYHHFWAEEYVRVTTDSRHIVRVDEVGHVPVVTGEHRPALLMQLADGTLMDLVPPGGLPPQRAQWLLRQLGVALRSIHEKHILHRDLKASNVFFVEEDGGQVRLLLGDFGASHTASGATLGHTIVFMPAWASPEQLQLALGDKNVKLKENSDSFPFGLIAAYVHTGRQPQSWGLGQSGYAEQIRELLCNEGTHVLQQMPHVAKHLLFDCTAPAFERPTVTQLLDTHEYFRETLCSADLAADPHGLEGGGWLETVRHLKKPAPAAAAAAAAAAPAPDAMQE